jgi:hypothetical protein
MSHQATVPQSLVDQRPSFGRKKKKKGYSPNQVVGKSGILRADKRMKAKFL